MMLMLSPTQDMLFFDDCGWTDHCAALTTR